MQKSSLTQGGVPAAGEPSVIMSDADLLQSEEV